MLLICQNFFTCMTMAYNVLTKNETWMFMYVVDPFQVDLELPNLNNLLAQLINSCVFACNVLSASSGIRAKMITTERSKIFIMAAIFTMPKIDRCRTCAIINTYSRKLQILYIAVSRVESTGSR